MEQWGRQTDPIEEKYQAMGGSAGFLGAPVTTLAQTSDGRGSVRQFQNGAIYWTPQTGAYEVNGGIYQKYVSLGAESSFLRYPLTDETPTVDGVGRYNRFEGGRIYWSPQTGVHELHGGINDKFVTLGAEGGLLGYPTSDETGAADGVGRLQQFQKGTIYFYPGLGAHEVHGVIRDRYLQLGGEHSFLGYPITDELPAPDGLGGRYSHFQRGTIYHSPRRGLMVVPSLFLLLR